MLFQKSSILPFPHKLTVGKLLGFVFLIGVSVLWNAIAQADIVMSLNKITTEQDVFTNVPNASSVKYAINYGNTAVDGTIDGVTFVDRLGAQTQNGTTGSPGFYYVRNSDNAYQSAQQSFAAHNSGDVLVAGNTYNGTASSGLNKLLSSMAYNNGQPENSPCVVTFGNLEAGKTYTARILARSWSTNTADRLHTFSIDTNADGVAEKFYSNIAGATVTGQQVSEDQPFSYAGDTDYTGAYAVDFTFTAQSNTASIYLNKDTATNLNKGWHNYGVMLLETSANQVLPSTPTLYNGSFETDDCYIKNHSGNGAQHGYIGESHAGLISGWQFVNLTNNTPRAGFAWQGGTCQDFLQNQTPTDGAKVAFLQSASNDDSRLYQNVYGFDPADKDTVYRVSMDLGRRGGSASYVAPNMSLYIGADQASEDVYISKSVSQSSGFLPASAVFVPNATMQTIVIGNKTSGDSTLLIDNVQLNAYSLTTFFSDNFHVKANAKGAAIGGPSNNDEADRFGGLLGGLNYTVKAKSNDQIQVGNGDYDGKCQEALFFATHNSGYEESHASPNYNFANVGAMTTAEEGGRMYDISFRVAPQFDENADSTNWAAVIFGTTASKQLANVASSDGVGILFRRNGGIQIFDGTNGNEKLADLGAGTFSLTDDWADVRVVYYVPDFNRTSPVDVSLYVNDVLIKSIQTANGFTDNFIQFEGYSANSEYKRSLIDDVVIKSSAELYYDVSRIQDLNRDWSPNGKDKLDVIFNAPRSDESTFAVHTGAITLEADTEFNIDSEYTLKQTGAVTGDYTITKTGDGTFQIYGAAAGDVDVQSLVVSSGRLDFKGYMAGAIEVGEDAVFSPGNSVGTMEQTGNFTLGSDAILLMEIGGLTEELNDQLIVNGATTFEDGSIIQFVPDSTFTPSNGDTIYVKMPEVDWNKAIFSSYYFTYQGYENGAVILGVNPNAVPEPSTWALLALGCVGLMYLRKRVRD